MAKVSCNLSGTTWPNGLPPNWCIQNPIHDVSLWYDKRYLILKNEAEVPMRAQVRRTLNSGQQTTFEFDVRRAFKGNNPRLGETPQIVWLAGADTGRIELLDAQEAPDDDVLEGLTHLAVEQEDGLADQKLVFIRSHWPVPVYVSMDITWRGTEHQPFREVMEPYGRNLIVNDYHTMDSTWKWRAATLQRLDLYAPWPPTSVRKVMTAS